MRPSNNHFLPYLIGKINWNSIISKQRNLPQKTIHWNPGKLIHFTCIFTNMMTLSCGNDTLQYIFLKNLWGNKFFFSFNNRKLRGPKLRGDPDGHRCTQKTLILKRKYTRCEKISISEQHLRCSSRTMKDGLKRFIVKIWGWNLGDYK